MVDLNRKIGGMHIVAAADDDVVLERNVANEKSSKNVCEGCNYFMGYAADGESWGCHLGGKTHTVHHLGSVETTKVGMIVHGSRKAPEGCPRKLEHIVITQEEEKQDGAS